MDMHDIQRVDRRTWQRYLFYMDLVVLVVFAVSMVLLVRHAFEAGQLLERAQWRDHSTLMWQIVTDTAFFVASFLWIVIRYFRNQYVVLTRGW